MAAVQLIWSLCRKRPGKALRDQAYFHGGPKWGPGRVHGVPGSAKVWESSVKSSCGWSRKQKGARCRRNQVLLLHFPRKKTRKGWWGYPISNSAELAAFTEFVELSSETTGEAAAPKPLPHVPRVRITVVYAKCFKSWLFWWWWWSRWWRATQ